MLYSRSDFIFGPSMFFLLRRPPPESTLFPYTTLFRSQRLGRQAVLCRDLDQRVDGGDRLRGHAALEPIAHRLRGERRGERSEEHTSELQSHSDLVCRLLLEKKNDSRDWSNRLTDEPPA